MLHAVAELTEDAVHRGIAHLQAAEFLYETRLFPSPEYTFKHALTHEVTYGTVLQERRKALHARIVGAIERFYPERLTEHVEGLAHHAVRGDVGPRGEVLAPGEKAVARSANREAVAFFEQALTALPQLPDSRETLGEALDIRIALGPCLGTIHGHGLAVLAEIPNEARETVYAAEVHRRRGELLLSQGDAHASEAETCFRRAVESARRGGHHSFEIRAATSLSRLLQRQGKREDARHMLAETYSWFTEGFDTADLQDAKTLLDELSVASR